VQVARITTLRFQLSDLLFLLPLRSSPKEIVSNTIQASRIALWREKKVSKSRQA
jgi:hypothetical protein